MPNAEGRAFFDHDELPDGVRGLFARSGVSLSLADFRAPDCPLIGINAAFCELTGYAPSEALGRNCRFLQPSTGPGPVRKRMRRFLENEKTRDDRFLVPNVRRDGTEFLNLVYMTKLERHGRVELVLASQFAVGGTAARDRDIYDKAVKEDLRMLNMLASDGNWAVLGSFEALASSNSIIVQSKLV